MTQADLHRTGSLLPHHRDRRQSSRSPAQRRDVAFLHEGAVGGADDAVVRHTRRPGRRPTFRRCRADPIPSALPTSTTGDGLLNLAHVFGFVLLPCRRRNRSGSREVLFACRSVSGRCRPSTIPPSAAVREAPAGSRRRSRRLPLGGGFGLTTNAAPDEAGPDSASHQHRGGPSSSRSREGAGSRDGGSSSPADGRPGARARRTTRWPPRRPRSARSRRTDGQHRPDRAHRRDAARCTDRACARTAQEPPLQCRITIHELVQFLCGSFTRPSTAGWPSQPQVILSPAATRGIDVDLHAEDAALDLDETGERAG